MKAVVTIIIASAKKNYVVPKYYISIHASTFRFHLF